MSQPRQSSSALASLRLSAYTFDKGDYRPITANLVWTLKATEIFNPNENSTQKTHSSDSMPIFSLQPGVYILDVDCDLGSKTVEDIVLHPGAIIDEVVYFVLLEQKGITRHDGH